MNTNNFYGADWKYQEGATPLTNMALINTPRRQMAMPFNYNNNQMQSPFGGVGNRNPVPMAKNSPYKDNRNNIPTIQQRNPFNTIIGAPETTNMIRPQMNHDIKPLANVPFNSTMFLNPNVPKYNPNVQKFEPNPTTTKAIAKTAAVKEPQRQLTSNLNEQIRFFTGTADKIIKWHKIYKGPLCYYEVIAAISSIQEGATPLQKIFLIRDIKGPILQIVHYSNDYIKIENFVPGQMLRCVGRMIGPNIMQAVSIRDATSDEIQNLQRMCYISDHAITKILKDS